MSFQCVASSDDNPGEMVHAYDQGVEAFAARSSLTFGDPRDHFLQALDTPSQCFLATVAVGLTVVTVIVPTKETVEAQRATE